MQVINKKIKKDYIELVFDMENGHEYGYAQLIYRYSNHKVITSLYECKYEQKEGYNVAITAMDFRSHQCVIESGIVRYSKKAMKENVLDVDAGLIMSLAGNTNLEISANNAIEMVKELRNIFVSNFGM